MRHALRTRFALSLLPLIGACAVLGSGALLLGCTRLTGYCETHNDCPADQTCTADNHCTGPGGPGTEGGPGLPDGLVADLSGADFTGTPDTRMMTSRSLWVRRFGSIGGSNYGTAVTLDSIGNVVFAGKVDGSVDFGGGSKPPFGLGDGVVGKLTSDGKYIWAHSFGGTGSFAVANAVAADPLGNVVTVGQFNSTCDFGPGPATSTGVNDMFVVSYAANTGGYQWSHHHGWFGFNATATAVAVDRSGNIVVAGQFEQAINLGGSDLSATGRHDIFLAKFNGRSPSAGTHIWSKRLGGTDEDFAAALATDADGNIILAGHFSAATDLGGGQLNGSGGLDVVLAKFDKDGKHLWSNAYGGPGDDQSVGVSVDLSGNVALTGWFQGPGRVNFGGPALSATGNRDIFVARYAPTGTHLWSRHIGGKTGDNDVPGGIISDTGGNVAVIGTLQHSADLSGDGRVVMGSGAYNIFAARYDARGGAYLSAISFAGGKNTDMGRSIAYDRVSGNLFLTGSFGDAIDLGDGTRGPIGASDTFILRLEL